MTAQKMEDSPYLKALRLQDVLAALQFLATYPDYDLTVADFREKIGADPRSAGGWNEVLTEHPEFFRQSEHGADYSLVLRRARPKEGDPSSPKADRYRPPLSSSELSMLMDTAIQLQKYALEMRRDKRAWLPLFLTAVGTASAFAGSLLGAYIGRK